MDEDECLSGMRDRWPRWIFDRNLGGFRGQLLGGDIVLWARTPRELDGKIASHYQPGPQARHPR